MVTLVALTYGQAASIASLGLDTALVHFGARGSGDLKVLARRALTAAAAQGLLAAAVGWVLLRTVLESKVAPAAGAVTVAALAAPASLVMTHGHAVLRAAGRLVEASVLEVVAAVSILAVIVGGVVADRLDIAVVAAAAGAAASALLTTLLLHRLPGAGGGSAAPSWSPLLRYGLAGHVGTVFQNLNYRVDVFLVALMLSTTDVGVYAVGVSLAEGLLLLPNAMGTVVMQRAARSADEHRATEITLRLSLLVAVAGGAVLALVSPWLVPAVFGREFEGASTAILALLPGILSLVVWKTFVNDLAGRGFPGVKSTSAAVALVATLLGDVLLIPPFGIVGAAAASSVAYTAAAVVAARRHAAVTGRPFRAVALGPLR